MLKVKGGAAFAASLFLGKNSKKSIFLEKYEKNSKKTIEISMQTLDNTVRIESAIKSTLIIKVRIKVFSMI